MIGVPAELIAAHGAVSEQVARAMAEGARQTAGTDVAVAVTGIAGPSGGSEAKPVGLVHFACATATGTVHREQRFGPISRSAIRAGSVAAALQLALDCITAG
jgi:nicotinamide-nucleotide amidase